MSAQQLPLAISLPVTETFDTWVSGDNANAVEMLQHSAQPLVYLWGASGVGKSHLLHALCAHYPQLVYLPLAELVGQVDAQCLRGLEHYQWICLDDLDAVVQDPLWCEELFALFNRVHDLAQGKLVVTAHQSPSQLSVQLADLRSRLQWGLALQLQPLNDEQKIQAIQLRANALGLSLSYDTAQFMVQRLQRDLPNLIAALERLDKASIAAKRRLTTPFVKTILAL
jgi:DnaA family protein